MTALGEALPLLFIAYVWLVYRIAEWRSKPLTYNGFIITGLIGFLAISLLGHHKTTNDLQRLCELAGYGNNDPSFEHAHKEMNDICSKHDPDNDSDDNDRDFSPF